MKTPSRYIQPAPLGLFDAQDRLEQIRKLGDPLAAFDTVLDWTIFLPVLARIPRAEPKAPGGRPAYAPVLLFKILILQSLYGLSDEQAQFQILDRRSFHEFLGWTVADRAPEQNTLREFREKLTLAELFSALFAACNTRLTDPGFITRTGQIIAAAFVAVPGHATGGWSTRPSNGAKCRPVGSRIRNDWPTRTWTHGGRRRTSRTTRATRIRSWRT